MSYSAFLHLREIGLDNRKACDPKAAVPGVQIVAVIGPGCCAAQDDDYRGSARHSE